MWITYSAVFVLLGPLRTCSTKGLFITCSSKLKAKPAVTFNVTIIRTATLPCNTPAQLSLCLSPCQGWHRCVTHVYRAQGWRSQYPISKHGLNTNPNSLRIKVKSATNSCFSTSTSLKRTCVLIFISSSEITPSGQANQDAQEALNLVYFIYIYNTRGCVNVKTKQGLK